MDLSLFPPSLREYNKQRTGGQFTVRSANSPTYSLTRRPGIRKRETLEDVRQRERRRTHASTNAANKEKDGDTGYQPTAGSSCVKDQNEEKDASVCKAPTPLIQSNKADETTPESGTDGREKAVFERQGRTECRRYNLPSRSMSLDWRAGTRSPVRGSRADMSTLSTKEGAELNQHHGCLEERRTGTEIGMMGGVASSLHGHESATHVQDMSSANHTGQAADKISRGNSLPFRFRSESGSFSRFTEVLGGANGGQTIQERIEKLYGSASEKAASFPRRVSLGENRNSPQSRISVIWAEKDSNTSDCETSLIQETSTTREKSAAGQWQGQFHNRYSDEFKRGKAIIETGTKSLDRARSRYTIAAQIRSARTEGQTTKNTKPNNVLEETFKDSGFRESRGKEDSRPEEKIFNVNEMSSERSGRVKVQEKETNEGAKEQTAQGILSIDEDVFETNPQVITSRTAERKKFPEILSVPSAVIVRNRISQFEAMTQRATGHTPPPRRTFSVPTQFSKGFHGVKKSGSAKEISRQRDIGEEVKEAGEGKKAMGGQTTAPERSLSVDEVGLRLGKMETGGNYLSGETKNNLSEDFCKYARLKETLQIPLNEGAQRQSRKSYLDETDYSKVSSLEESSRRIMTTTNEPSPRPSCETTSPDSDDDKTPTNLPDKSPFLSPSPQTENAAPIAKRKKENTSVFTQADQSEDSVFLPLSPPAATSFHSDFSQPRLSEVEMEGLQGKKCMLDLSAWVSGSNPEYKCFSNDEGGSEDDDESTQVDEDSNYDSDSGESSVTITSNMSQSDRRSFSVRWVKLIIRIFPFLMEVIINKCFSSNFFFCSW